LTFVILIPQAEVEFAAIAWVAGNRDIPPELIAVCDELCGSIPGWSLCYNRRGTDQAADFLFDLLWYGDSDE